jgi:hypothetical protein
MLHSIDALQRRHASGGERRIRHDVHDVADVWCFHYEAMADEHSHESRGKASVPAEPGVGTRPPGVSRDSLVARYRLRMAPTTGKLTPLIVAVTANFRIAPTATGPRRWPNVGSIETSSARSSLTSTTRAG